MARTKDTSCDWYDLRHALLEQAKGESAELLAELPKDLRPVSPDIDAKIHTALKCELRKKHFLAFGRKLYPAISKIALIFLALFLICVLLVTQVSALRKRFYDWIISTQTDHIELRENKEPLKINEKNNEEQYIRGMASIYLTYVPHDLTLHHEEVTEISRTLVYQERDNNNHRFTIHALRKNSTIQIDNSALKEVEIKGGVPAYLTENKGEISLIWSLNDYLITVSSTLGEEETMRIAEGLSLNLR